VIAFTPAELRVRSEGTVRARAGAEVRKAYGDVLFPRTGHAFSRPNSRFDPDAYSHGGISLQEMLIPMVVLQVKPAEGDALVVDLDGGPSDVMEGQDVELTLRLRPTGGEEIPVTVEAAYARDPDRFPIPRQTVFVGPDGKTVPIRFRPGADDATDDERRAGQMERTLVVSAAWQRGGRTFRRSRSHRFTVRLRSDVIIRRVGSLGSILGLTPKGRL
jgi:hypothetical protein